MRDARIVELARILTGYSTEVKPGDIVLVSASGVESLPLVKAVHAEALRKGARYVEVQVELPELARQFYDLAGAEQLAFFPEHRLEFMKKVDVSIGISAPANAMTLARADQGKMLAYQKLLRPIIDQRVRHTRWVITRFPTPGAAQDARMSLDEYEDFFFSACNRDWSEESAKQERLKRLLESADRVRILAHDTDLSFSIAGMPAIKCDGRFNIPDGEVFTAPLRESVEGHITFNAPALYSGREFNDIHLEFHKGRIVKASSSQDEEALNRIFDTDEGARYLGEFAVGVNAGIQTPMRNVLFDEKIFGSVHLAAGSSYEECDNGNQSAVHWDMVRLLNDGGALYLDEALIIQNGRFTHPDLLDLNPPEGCGP
jgi:aminopeptidase